MSQLGFTIMILKVMEEVNNSLRYSSQESHKALLALGSLTLSAFIGVC
jgi:hypothetical protein